MLLLEIVVTNTAVRLNIDFKLTLDVQILFVKLTSVLVCDGSVCDVR